MKNSKLIMLAMVLNTIKLKTGDDGKSTEPVTEVVTGKIVAYRDAKPTSNGLPRYMVRLNVGGKIKEFGLLVNPSSMSGELTLEGKQAVIDGTPIFTEDKQPIMNWTVWSEAALTFEEKCNIAKSFGLKFD